MDAVSEQWYNENLDEDIQKNRTDFLDNFELDLAKIHRNTKKELQPILGKNVLSLKSEYANGENTLFHAHPSISTLSLNNGTNGGDLVHAYEADKKVFAINKNGDIFYTNPQLAGNCLINMNQPVGCPKSIGQVYVGNIKDFMK